MREPERPCDCHGHDQGKCGERGEEVCSEGTAKGAGLSGEPWEEEKDWKHLDNHSDFADFGHL